jgi:hypothetical protein
MVLMENFTKEVEDLVAMTTDDEASSWSTDSNGCWGRLRTISCKAWSPKSQSIRLESTCVK